MTNEMVNDIAIQYAWSDWHNIPSEEFGAYWVGRFSIPVTQTRQINISQGWSEITLLIDQEVVYEGGDSQEIFYTFEPGDHLIEVEYINSWHTTSLLVNFLEPIPRVEPDAIEEWLNHLATEEFDLLYVDLYDTDSFDNSVLLTIQPWEKPIVLLLTSYEPIKWQVHNPEEVQIRGIIYSSYDSGSHVVGDITPDTFLLPYKYLRQVEVHDISTCYCAEDGYLYCGLEPYFTPTEILMHLIGQKPSGFTSAYSAESVVVPENYFKDDIISEFEEVSREAEEMRASCSAQD